MLEQQKVRSLVKNMSRTTTNDMHMASTKYNTRGELMNKTQDSLIGYDSVLSSSLQDE